MGGPTIVFDFDYHYYFLCALVVVGMQLFFFAIAATCKFDKVTDFAGSMNFVVLAVMTLVLGNAYEPRQIMLTVLVVAARLELAFFLLLRVLKRGKDARFDSIRDRFFAFLMFWVFQMIWVWGVTLSTVYINAQSNYDGGQLGVADWVGLAMFVLGFFIQILADFQKNAFRSNPANKSICCTTGVWSWSRHPNYFGEILLWWGIFVSASAGVPSSDPSGWSIFVSPLLTMLILLGPSGVLGSERETFQRYGKHSPPSTDAANAGSLLTMEQGGSYAQYVAQTSILLPMPPAVWRNLPGFVKGLLFEWSCFMPKELKTTMRKFKLQ